MVILRLLNEWTHFSIKMVSLVTYLGLILLSDHRTLPFSSAQLQGWGGHAAINKQAQQYDDQYIPL